jgi:hypothetical protein
VLVVPLSPQKCVTIKLAEAADGGGHLALKRLAAHLAIADDFQTDALLQRDGIVDGAIFDGFELSGSNRPNSELLLGQQQLRGPEKAADDVSVGGDHALQFRATLPRKSELSIWNFYQISTGFEYSLAILPSICLEFPATILPKHELVTREQIENSNLLIRGLKVMLDSDRAGLYGVNVKRLIEQVRRNLKRFPSDFTIRLNREEFDVLRSHFATLKQGRGEHRKYLPYAFTE